MVGCINWTVMVTPLLNVLSTAQQNLNLKWQQAASVRGIKWALIVTTLLNEPSSFVANWLKKKIRWLFPRLFQNHWLSCFSTITVTISNILRLKTDLYINLFPQFSFSHCQWRWLDSNPSPWGTEASVLLLCYCFWPIGRHHLLDGVTNSKYKLLPFSTKKTFFAKRRRH